jgi:two-component system, NarL family, response regulator LiaR
MTIRVALADDHRVVTGSLRAYLESFPDLTIVGVATSGEELLANIAAWNPHVVLQDLLMPGGWDGIETTKRLVAFMPDVRVVALTASIEEARMVGVLRAGATGYVRKNAEPGTLVAAIRAVAAGRTYIDPAAARQLVASSVAPEELTARERDVLRHLALGRSNKEIAAALAIAEETVKTHVAHVLGKLQAENRGHAAVQALKRGIISLEELS